MFLVCLGVLGCLIMAFVLGICVQVDFDVVGWCIVWFLVFGIC